MAEVEHPPAIDTFARPLRMTYEEYQIWSGDRRAEWKDGEVIIFTTAKKYHQRVVQFLFVLIDTFARLLDLGEVGTGPAEVRLWPGGPSREPDIFFVRKDQLGRWTEDRLEGGPDLVVEVISNDSVGRDRGDKYYEYEEAGVAEYWIVDPRPGKKRAEFHRLDEHGRYQIAPPEAGLFHSHVLPGFVLPVAWLWQDPALDPLAALATMGEGHPALLNELRQRMSGL